MFVERRTQTGIDVVSRQPPGLQFKMQRLVFTRGERLNPVHRGRERFRSLRAFRLGCKMFHLPDIHGKLAGVQIGIPQTRLGKAGVIGEEFFLQHFRGQLRFGLHGEEKNVREEIRLICLEHAGGKEDFLDARQAEVRRKALWRQCDALTKPFGCGLGNVKLLLRQRLRRRQRKPGQCQADEYG